jgi:SWI/SNF-related matrix-associated actin-dependent regulator of chromatin subfamily A member 5
MDRKDSQLGLRPKTPVKRAKSTQSSPPSEASQTIVVDGSTGDEEDSFTQEHDEIEYKTPSRARSSLRVRKPNMSLKAAENVANSLSKPRPKRSARNAISDLIGADLNAIQMSPVVSRRVAIRQEIASKTVQYRDRFLFEKRDFFLPLLPAHNYISKLMEKHAVMSEAERAQLPTITPYKEIDTQPAGVKAIMKPYQLSGLSFMVYLHHNVSKFSFPANTANI